AEFGRIDDDFALDPIRDDPEFSDVINAGKRDRRYSTVWSDDGPYESVVLSGIDPNEQLARCRRLLEDGYRPAAVSVARTVSTGPLSSVSVWQRPRPSEEEKERLAKRQAKAAVALIRMGKSEEIWPLLQHSPDPRLRSWIISLLSPLQADP